VLTAVSYVLYVRSDPLFGANAAFVTVLSTPFALFGLARYLQLLMVDAGGGNPTRALFSDRVTLANAALWSLLICGSVLFSPAVS
jgi:decaprenyl-phosphate phosphoribosyltransferase